MIYFIFLFLYIIGLIAASLATIVAIGYGLYLWGSVGLPLPESAWAAFVFGIKFFGAGVLSVIIGGAGLLSTR